MRALSSALARSLVVSPPRASAKTSAADVIKVCVTGWPGDAYANPEAHELPDSLLRAVVFAGFGQVVATAGDIFNAQLLPAGGVGLRYQLTRKYPMHMRLDYA